jgi:hypothetical protein
LLEYLQSIAQAAVAILAGNLPKRYWPALPALPIRRMSLLSAALTISTAAVIGLGGFLAYSERVGREAARLILSAGEAQLQRRVPSDPAVNVAPLGVAALTPFAFMLTPVGLLTTYLALSGFARVAGWATDEPFGDPILTGLDAAARRVAERVGSARRRRQRERAEGVEVRDRLYPAAWAGVSDADYVVVASRRKPDWNAGTFVVTSEKWYVCGTPFDIQLPEGLRTIYPLKEHTTLDVMRRGVPYELPPFRGGSKLPP